MKQQTVKLNNKNVVKDKTKDGTRGEGPYTSVQLNGNSTRAPPWPQPHLQNEKMFILPKILDRNDTIVITGTTYDQRRRFTIGLVTGFPSPDYSNVACQLDVDFYDLNKISIQTIKNGNSATINEENAATDYFSDPLSFEVKFKVRSQNVVDVLVGTSHLESVELQHDVNEIRFLTAYGDIAKVSRLDFNFG